MASKPRMYQMQLIHQEFPELLNVAVVLKTKLTTKTWVQVVLTKSDLELSYDQLIDLFSLHFQIELIFRNAIQFWDLKDFMNITPTAVTIAVNLSLFIQSQ